MSLGNGRSTGFLRALDQPRNRIAAFAFSLYVEYIPVAGPALYDQSSPPGRRIGRKNQYTG